MIKTLVLPVFGTALCLSLPFVAGAATGEMRLSEADCRRLVEHRVAEDTTYKPGLDVRGNPVAPADLNGGSKSAVPDTLVVVLTLDLVERLGLAPGIGGLEADVPIGLIEIDGSVVSLNGRRLAPDAEQTLSSVCQSALEQSAKAK